MKKKLGKWSAIFIFLIIAQIATGQEMNGEQIMLDSADFLQSHEVLINTAFCNETKIEGTVIGSLNLPSGFYLALKDGNDTTLMRVDCIVAITILDYISWINEPFGCVSYETHICGIPAISGSSWGHFDYRGEAFYVLKSCSQKMVLVNQRYVSGKTNIGCCPDAS